MRAIEIIRDDRAVTLSTYAIASCSVASFGDKNDYEVTITGDGGDVMYLIDQLTETQARELYEKVRNALSGMPGFCESRVVIDMRQKP